MSTLWRADDRFIKTYFTKYPVSVLNASVRTTPVLLVDQYLTLEKSDSLGAKSRRKRLWNYFGGTRVKRNMEEFGAEWHSVDCSDDSKILRETAIRSKLLFKTIKSQEN